MKCQSVGAAIKDNGIGVAYEFAFAIVVGEAARDVSAVRYVTVASYNSDASLGKGIAAPTADNGAGIYELKVATNNRPPAYTCEIVFGANRLKTAFAAGNETAVGEI